MIADQFTVMMVRLIGWDGILDVLALTFTVALIGLAYLVVFMVRSRILNQIRRENPLPIDFDSCPHCRGSFAFRKPSSYLCPWCGGNMIVILDE